MHGCLVHTTTLAYTITQPNTARGEPISCPPTPLPIFCTRQISMQWIALYFLLRQAAPLKPTSAEPVSSRSAPDAPCALSSEQIRSLAHWAYQFTPSVCLHMPLDGQSAGLLLEVQPSLTLFGGLSALCDRIQAGLSDMGYTAQMGVSITATSAWWLCRHPTPHSVRITESSSLLKLLPELPVGVLDQAHTHGGTWHACGINRIADLLQLPRTGLARRFGTSLLSELDLGFGRKADTHRWIQPPPVFQRQTEMPFHTHSLQGILGCATPLLDALECWLTGQRAATRCLVFTFRHDRDHHTQREIRSAQAHSRAKTWRQLLQDELTREPLCSEVTDLCLEVSALEPLADHTGALFPGLAEQQQAWEQLLSRLHARLGAEHLQGLRSRPDPRPEKAQQLYATHLSSPAKRTPEPASTGPLRLPRPLWFLPEPRRLRPPPGPDRLTLLAGPERIEFGWWDGNAVERDYFIAQDSEQRQLWVFRQKPGTGERAHWYVQGLFA